MADTQHRELELMIDLVLARADLQVTKKVDELKSDLQLLPHLMDQKINCYDREQESRRRWTIRTLLTTLGLVLAALGFLATHWPK